MCDDEGYTQQILKRKVTIRVSPLTTSFSIDTLKKEIGTGSWMKEEFVLLLVKEKNYSAALDSYVDDKKFDKVEEFCTTQNEAGLLTQLLTKYFEKHKKHVELKNIKEAEEFRRLALRLMQNQSSKNQLDPRVVLEKIPASWRFKESDVDLIGFLSSLFDYQLTIEENTKIAERII